MKAAATDRAEVVVVGAGPVGATVAAEIAAAGHAVRLLDAGDTADHQEFLDAQAADVLRYLGLKSVLDEATALPHHRLEVRAADPRAAFTADSPRPGAYVPRTVLRTRLLALAAERGVRRVPGRATRVLQDGGRIEGVAHRALGAGSERRLRAPLVIDATGGQAWLSRQGLAGARQLEGPGRLVTARAFARLPAGEEVVDLRVHRGEPLHFGWILPAADGRVEVGITAPLAEWRRREARGDALLTVASSVDPALATLLEPASRQRTVDRGELWTCTVAPFAGPGWLCVGDAHAVSDPVLGLGLGLGLAEAVRAARAVADHLEGRGDAFADYVAYARRGRSAAADLTRYLRRYPTFFAGRMRGEMREDLERLVSGALFDDPPLPALAHLRRSLRGGPAGAAGSQAREIAQRVRARYEDHREVQAAFLEVNDDGALVSLVLDEVTEGSDGLHEVEEALYQEFGRDHLAVVRWSGDARRGLAPPEFDAEHVIFDRRAS